MAFSTKNTSLLDISALYQLKNPRIAVVYTEWNEHIVTELRMGAQKIAQQVGAVITHEIAVPGSFELAFGCRTLFEATHLHAEAPMAIIAFGTVIRGGTPHFEYVCKAVTEGITQLNLTLPIPVIYGVLTLNNEQEAFERLGGAHGHKGEEAMISALKMIKMTMDFQT